MNKSGSKKNKKRRKLLFHHHLNYYLAKKILTHMREPVFYIIINFLITHR